MIQKIKDMHIKKRDIIIMSILLLVIIGSIIGSYIVQHQPKTKEVVVQVNGKEILRTPLNKDAIYVIKDGVAELSDDPDISIEKMGKEAVATWHDVNILYIKDNKAFIKESNCSNQVCVHSPAITGENFDFPIACLPHALVVTIE